MFYDRESMSEMYESSLKKPEWTRVLVTFELLDDTIKTKETIEMLCIWREKVRNSLKENDAAYEINKGNIFILLHESNQKTFDKSLSDFMIHANNGQEGASSFIMYLTNEESSFLMNMNQ